MILRSCTVRWVSLNGWCSLLFLMLLEAATAVDNCPAALQTVPSEPIGQADPYVSPGGLAAAASDQTTYCCPHGPIDQWIFAYNNDLGYIGSISAVCDDGKQLPTTTYGYNGTAGNCSTNLSMTYTEAATLSGTISYDVDVILEAIFYGNSTLSCQDGLVPVGFSASSSCFSVTQFQVHCGEPRAPPPCPSSSLLVPSIPLGSSNPAILGPAANQTSFTYTSAASPADTHCCPTGHISNWLTANTADNEFVASLGAMCSDGSSLTNVTYGYNGSSSTSCSTNVVQQMNISSPSSGNFSFRAGLILDSFLSAGAVIAANESYFQCPNGQVAIGFRVKRNCLALTELQVVCDSPVLAPSPAPRTSTAPGPSSAAAQTASSAASSRGGGISGGAVAGIVLGVVVGLALAALLAFFLIRRQKFRGLTRTYGEEGFDQRHFSHIDPFGEGVPISGNKAAQSSKTSATAGSGNSSIPFPDISDEDAVNMEEVRLHTTDCNLSSLPDSWRIPIEQVELQASQGRPVVLGKGGFGLVYLGIVRREKAAIKVVIGGGLREQARLLHEIEILERCRSTHIVQFLGYSLHNNQLLLAMAYQPGGTLYKSLRRSRDYQFYGRGKEALEQICIALIHLHSIGIAHLDLKTPNVLIAADGSVKLADVGLGKLLKGHDTPVTQVGTFAWSSPEQLIECRGSHASDIWALGTIIHEICTLEEPERQLRRQIAVPEEAPQEVADLVDQCRMETPGDRLTASQVLDILTSHIHSQGSAT